MKIELMATEQIDRDIMRARERPTPTGWSGKLGWRNIAASIGYVALYEPTKPLATTPELRIVTIRSTMTSEVLRRPA